jgi:hypothetical protein
MAVGAGLPDLAGTILLIESTDLGLGRADRALTQLMNAGCLAGIAGVAVGQFLGYREAEPGRWTIVDVLGRSPHQPGGSRAGRSADRTRLAPADAPAGHTSDDRHRCGHIERGRRGELSCPTETRVGGRTDRDPRKVR